MKMTWKKKSGKKRIAVTPSSFQTHEHEHDDHQQSHNSPSNTTINNDDDDDDSDPSSLAHTFLHHGNNLAQGGKYREALGKWETAINLMPQKALLHEQKAQVLLEIGDAWGALKAATRATELEPEWAEAWTTLGRAQLNFGEPDTAIESFDKALSIKPDMRESRDDRQTAIQLVKKRKQLHSSGLTPDKLRYQVGDEGESKLPG